MANALSFNGSSAYVDLGSSLSPTGSISVEAWIYQSGTSGNQRVVANSHTDDPADNKGFELFLGGGVGYNHIGYTFIVGNGTTSLGATIQTTLITNTWLHMVGTYNAATGVITLYQNNQVLNQTSSAGFGNVSAGNNHVCIGFNPTYVGDYFNGKTQKVAIYNTCLSPSQVSMLYNNGTGLFGDKNDPNLLAGYNFTEGSGTTTADYSVGSHTGTLSGSTLPTWTTVDNQLSPNWSKRTSGGIIPSRVRRSDGKAMVPRGISMSGLEFAASTLPGVQGTDFTENQSGDYTYVGNTNKNFNTVRVPFLWERLQPTLGSALNSTYKGYIDDNITWAASNGLGVILECHNYGRYSISGTTHIIGDGTLTQANFVDLWNRLSSAYANNSTVLAYDLMNEPHDMTVGSSPSTYNSTATWTLAAQAAINQIRSNGDTKWIIAELDGWAGIQSFTTNYGNNPIPWLTDSQNRLRYSFHYYMDQNHSGTYSGGSDTPANNLATIQSDIMPFITWAMANNIPLHCGEYGVPNTNNDWLNNLEVFLSICDKYGIWTNHWAMGSWYSSTTTLEPTSSWTVDVNQMKTVGKHLGITIS